MRRPYAAPVRITPAISPGAVDLPGNGHESPPWEHGPMGVDALADLMPLLRTLEIELTDASSEVVRARMAWAPARCTAGGILHGGALMALADSCGGISAYLNMPDGASGTATIESKTNLFRAVTGGVVTAQSRPLHRGR